jgi:acyl-CoA reductase-like NAD-dependent aldehyde dehydrogenase
MPLIASIASGNASLVKPSDVSSCSALVLEKILNKINNWPIRTALGGKEIIEELLEKSWGHIFYTGGIQAGKNIMKKAALKVIPITLELGGKSPVIIDDKVDLKMAAKRIMWGKCLNAGQTCVAPDYVLLKEEMIVPFVKNAREFLANSFVDIKNNENYSRIINEHHTNRLINCLSYGKILLGGDYSIKERFIEPTLLTDIKINSPLGDDEIFGPILPIIPYKNIDEAINYIKQKPSPLVVYLFSNNKVTMEKVGKNTSSGSFVVNDVVSFLGIKNLPFGGIGSSGMGQYRGEFGFYNLSHLRPCYHRSNFIDISLRYPPYSEKIKAWFKKIL